MEKRISSTEYRLGIYTGWPIKFQNLKKKFYTDSLRINLLMNQVFNILQNQSKILIPTSLINIYINNKVININFGYFQLQNIDRNEKFTFSDIIDKSDDNEETKFIDSDSFLEKDIMPLLKKKILTQKKKLKNINLIQTIKRFKLIKNVKKYTRYKFFFAKTFMYILHRKWNEYVIEQIFTTLFKRIVYNLVINLDLLFLKNYNLISKNTFYNIKEWYRKIGGNLFQINKQLLLLHYALTYKNFTPLILIKLKNDLESNPYRQKYIMNLFYNLLLSYSEIQRNIFGIKIDFKGAIGQHGRTKTVQFFTGRLYNFELVMPIEYAAINVNSIFGSIGVRWWFSYLENFTEKHLQKIEFSKKRIIKI
jgi:hypothetical protein